jgi:hypothetical protein
MPLSCWDCGFESRPGHGCLSLMSVACCHIEVSAFGLITRQEESYRVWYVCDREASIMRRRWPTGGCYVMKCVMNSNRLAIVCSRDLSCISGEQINGLLGSVIQVVQVCWGNDQSTRKQAGRINLCQWHFVTRAMNRIFSDLKFYFTGIELSFWTVLRMNGLSSLKSMWRTTVYY